MVYLVYDPFTKNHKFLINNLKHNLKVFNQKLDEIHEVNECDDKENTYIILINQQVLQLVKH